MSPLYFELSSSILMIMAILVIHFKVCSAITEEEQNGILMENSIHGINDIVNDLGEVIQKFSVQMNHLFSKAKGIPRLAKEVVKEFPKKEFGRKASERVERREAFIKECRQAGEMVSFSRLIYRNKAIPFESSCVMWMKIAVVDMISESKGEDIALVIYDLEKCIWKRACPFGLGRYAEEISILNLLAGAGGAPELRAVTWSGSSYVMTFRGKKSLQAIVSHETLKLQDLKVFMAKICMRVKEIHLKGISHNNLTLKNVFGFDFSGPLFLADFEFSSPLGQPVPKDFSRRLHGIVGGIVTTAYDVHRIGLMMLQLMTQHQIQNKGLEGLAIRAMNFELGEWPSVVELAEDIEKAN